MRPFDHRMVDERPPLFAMIMAPDVGMQSAPAQGRLPSRFGAARLARAEPGGTFAVSIAS